MSAEGLESTRRFEGRVIREGVAAGKALVSSDPVSFYGGVDLDTGVVVERGHPLAGQALQDRVLVIPRGKGSTVGSWAILRLARRGLGPRALLCEQCETIVAAGVILAEIPCVDGLRVEDFRTGDTLRVEGAVVEMVAGGETDEADEGDEADEAGDGDEAGEVREARAPGPGEPVS
jgi:hypothetical protein